MNEEVIERLSKKHNLPEEQIKLIVQSFHDGLRHYLSHPLESKGGVMIHNLLTFYINEKRVKREIERYKLKTYLRKPGALEEKLDFHYDILENTSKYERQVSKKIISKQPDSGTPEGE